MHDLPTKIDGDTELNIAGVLAVLFTVFIILI